MWLRLDARPFSPRPPPLVAQPCSGASSTLRACPTPPACSSSAMPFGFPLRPTSPLTVGRLEVSQIQAKCFRTCMGVSDPGCPSPSRLSTRWILPSACPDDVGASNCYRFRGSLPSLCLPLSTLRPQPRDCQRMTQGRGGLLGLPRMALSSTTLLLAHWRFRRRRDVPYGTPPPRIPACRIAAPGSCLRSTPSAVGSLFERDDRFGPG